MSWRLGGAQRLLALSLCLGASLLLHVWALSQTWAPAVKTGIYPVPKQAFAIRISAAGDASPLPAPAQQKGMPAENLVPSLSPSRALQPIADSEVHSARQMPTEFAEQGGSDGLDGYVPRPLLTVAPLAHEPVFLQWPESLFEGGEGDPLPGAQFIGVLALYIDEAGWVQTVRVQEGNLAPAMVEAAKRAFQGVRFSAGELNGQLVKSRIYVEVVFDRPDTRPSGRGAVH